MAGIKTTPSTAFSNPAWAKDYGNREHLVAGGARVDPNQFPRENNVIVTVGTGGAAIGATSIPVTALSGPIPSGTTLRFSNGVSAFTTAAVVAGATAIPVEALGAAVPAGATATYEASGKIYIRSGTFIGRTIAERDAGTGFGPVADTDLAAGAGEGYLLYHDIDDAAENPDATLYRHASMVDEAHLPGFATLTTAQRDYLRARYHCMRGAD